MSSKSNTRKKVGDFVRITRSQSNKRKEPPHKETQPVKRMKNDIIKKGGNNNKNDTNNDQKNTFKNSRSCQEHRRRRAKCSLECPNRVIVECCIPSVKKGGIVKKGGKGGINGRRRSKRIGIEDAEIGVWRDFIKIKKDFIFDESDEEKDDFEDCFEYEEEISKMMYSFGDFEMSNERSVRLLETLGSFYIKEILGRLTKGVIEKCSTIDGNRVDFREKIGLEGLVECVGKRERDTLKRTVKFVRQNKRVLDTHQGVIQDDFDQIQIKSKCFHSEDEESISDSKYLIESFWDFIKGESSSAKSSKIASRLQYRNEISSSLSTEEYLKFAKCTKVNFARPFSLRNKFVVWAKLDTYSFKLSKECIEVLGDLLYDMIERVVRGALPFRTDAENALSPSNIFQFLTQATRPPRSVMP